MYLFLTNRFYLQTSAIELAEVKRQKIFDSLDIPNEIVEIEDNYDHPVIEHNLQMKEHRIINIFDYFQGINSGIPNYRYPTVSDFYGTDNYHLMDDDTYINQDHSILVGMRNEKVYYVDYKDQYGFLDRRDFYKYGYLSRTDFYADDGRVLIKQWFNAAGQPVITYYYRGGNNHQVALTIIHLKTKGKTLSFTSEAEFIRFFIQELVEQYHDPTLIIDRSLPLLDVLNKSFIKTEVYFVFHSLFAVNGKLRVAYKSIPNQIKKGIINKLIVATEAEKKDLINLLNIQSEVVKSIPVTYSNKIEHINFDQRDPNKILLISRISSEKQVEQAVKAIINVHKTNPNIYLNIWGYGDAYDGNKAIQALNNLIKKSAAQRYINICGFSLDLEKEYNSASIQLLTSKYEGFSMALLEGQEHGLPAISYNVAYGPSDIIRDGITGYLIETNNLEELQEKLELLIRNRTERKRLSENSYVASNRYSFAKIREKWLSVIKGEN